MLTRQLEDRGVQARAHVVDRVADDRQKLRGHLLEHVKPEHDLAWFVGCLRADLVWLGQLEARSPASRMCLS